MLDPRGERRTEGQWLERELAALLPLVGDRIPVPPARWEGVRRRLGLDRGHRLTRRVCSVVASGLVALLLASSLTLPSVHAREIRRDGPAIQLVPVPPPRRSVPLARTRSVTAGRMEPAPTYAPLPTPEAASR